MEKRTKIAFIVNPISGTKDKRHIIDLIPEYLDDRHFEWSISMTEYRGHAAKIADKAVSEGVDVAVAVGGDAEEFENGPAGGLSEIQFLRRFAGPFA